jgi:hypothetical protein
VVAAKTEKKSAVSRKVKAEGSDQTAASSSTATATTTREDNKETDEIGSDLDDPEELESDPEDEPGEQGDVIIALYEKASLLLEFLEPGH